MCIICNKYFNTIYFRGLRAVAQWLTFKTPTAVGSNLTSVWNDYV